MSKVNKSFRWQGDGRLYDTVSQPVKFSLSSSQNVHVVVPLQQNAASSLDLLGILATSELGRCPR